MAVWLTVAASVFAGGDRAVKGSTWSQARWGELGLLDSADDKETGITALAASADGTRVATGHAGGLVRLWNPATGIELAVLDGHRREVCALAFTDMGRTLVSVAAGEIMRWDTASGRRQKTIELKAGPFEHAVLTTDARLLLGATREGRVLLVDVATGVQTASLDRPARPVLALAVSPDGKAVACAEDEGGLSVWNLDTRRAEVEMASEQPRLPHALAFSPDGRLIAVSVGRDGVIVWDRVAKTRRLVFGPTKLRPSALAFSADRRGVVVGTANGSILTCDLTTGETGPALRGHPGQIQRMLVLPGQQFVTAAADTTVRMWRAYLPGEPEVKRPEPALSDREVASLVSDLRSTDPSRAERAVRPMLFVPNQSVALLRKLMAPVTPADPKRFAQLVADLENPRYAVRRKAFEEMQTMGESATDLIRQALAAGHALETYTRLRFLQRRLENRELLAELRLALRGVQVLARINSPEARAFLEELAAGVPGAHVTRAAKGVLQAQK